MLTHASITEMDESIPTCMSMDMDMDSPPSYLAVMREECRTVAGLGGSGSGITGGCGGRRAGGCGSGCDGRRRGGLVAVIFGLVKRGYGVYIARTAKAGGDGTEGERMMSEK